MEIYNVQMNHLQDPVGYRMQRVVLSWKVRGAAGKCQKAARAVVAADPEMRQILLDTGMTADADSLAWELPVELKPRTRYYFTITVESDAGETATSSVHFFETGKMDEPWTGRWISCDSTEPRHPYFEKTIAPKKSVKSARLYISGLGLYEAYYGDVRIGDEYLTPYCNDYNQWVQVQTYDMTEILQQAEAGAPGKLSVLLGNGWYKGRFGFKDIGRVGYFGDSWKLLAELHIAYTDGTEDVIGTDESWTVRRSTITFSNIYDGEHRDDTLPELPPEQAVFCDAPKGKLTDRMSTPVRIRKTFEPAELIHTPKGELVFDMGQEFTGIFRLKVSAPKGKLIHIQTGEILQNGCFYNENLRSAKSEYFFTSNGETVLLQPHFTFYGYRYVKIEGIPDLRKEDFVGYALYSEVPDRGTMETGHALLNQFLSNVRWGLRSNFVDVPTDCPQRDERMGWTGDAQVFSPTATYLTDTYAFYAKYLYDMYQEQLLLDGMVPNVVPACGLDGTATVWGDAACIMPWNLYLFYGDTHILEDQYESMKAWVEYIRRVDGTDHHWRDVFHFGDWLALDNMNGNPEEVRGATDEAFIANLYYAASAEIVSKTAHVLGKAEDETAYRALADEQYSAVKKEFYSATGRCCIKTQTALLLTLKYHLSDNVELTRKQLTELFAKAGDKLRTGFVGTPLMCGILSDNGMDGLAWKLLLNEDYPGWLHEIKLGATTVWERWNSILDDGTISGTSMNSMNHYAYGSVVEWMFRHIAGLDVGAALPDGTPAAGCRYMKIAPALHTALGHQETVYDSPAGEYRSSWTITDPAHVTVSVTVPFGCTADLVLPGAKDNAPIALTAGSYTYSYELETALV